MFQITCRMIGTFQFKTILKLRHYLTVTDEEKFWKARPILQTVISGCLLNKKFSAVAIDEQIISFYGHAPGIQFIKGK